MLNVSNFGLMSDEITPQEIHGLDHHVKVALVKNMRKVADALFNETINGNGELYDELTSLCSRLSLSALSFSKIRKALEGIQEIMIAIGKERIGESSYMNNIIEDISGKKPKGIIEEGWEDLGVL